MKKILPFVFASISVWAIIELVLARTDIFVGGPFYFILLGILYVLRLDTYSGITADIIIICFSAMFAIIAVLVKAKNA